MNKRTAGFARRQSDFYPTPPRAVEPLIPLLKAEKISRFAEPCCGDNSLTRELERHGLKCTYAGDISNGQDALLRTEFGNAQIIITNPPHSRPAMHSLIEHFANVLPSWILADVDWWHTKQAQPYAHLCSLILPIGRLKWFADSKFSGKDNYCWMKFDASNRKPTIILPRAL